MSNHYLSTFNLAQLAKQGHSLAQNLAQLASVAAEKPIPLESIYETEAVEGKFQEIQTLFRLVRRAMGEAEDMVFDAIAKRDGTTVQSLTGLRIHEIETILRLPEEEKSFREEELGKAVKELLPLAKEKIPGPYKGDDLIPKK